ncbi:MAG: hypothetical protein JSU08_00175 [Acidobacteria bacterium]|nr:hypothetical protein [Acidobacteriota bacterium]
MATSIRRFAEGLYTEHAEEASFLYVQRQKLRLDPEVGWRDLLDVEDRFEAHLDGLVLGGDRAAAICLALAGGDEAGAVHAALSVLGRQQMLQPALDLLGRLALDDAAVVRAAADALIREAPTAWRDHLRETLTRREAWPLIAARVVGYRRFAFEHDLLAACRTATAPAQAQIAWALGRVGTVASIPSLRAMLRTQDHALADASATALMRLGDDEPVRVAMSEGPGPQWMPIALSLGGEPHAATARLLEWLRTPHAGESTVLALGLLGDLAAVAPLLDLLGDEALGGAAAVALNTITGAALQARVFVPDPVDVELLTPDERVAFDLDGALPPAMARAGAWMRQPVRDKDRWYAWLAEHKGDFHRGTRWRDGRPHGPASLVSCLAADDTAHAVRSATYDELVIRYGLTIPFEPDLPVRQQVSLLERLNGWAFEHAPRFDPSHSYFAGTRQA